MLWVLKRTVSTETVLLGTKTDPFVFKIIITFLFSNKILLNWLLDLCVYVCMGESFQDQS